MGFSPTELSDQDFFHSYLAEYLDGELDGALRGRFETILASPGYSEVPEHFQAMRGRLQLALQSYYLREDELKQLKSFVMDPTVQATHEQAKIENLGRKEVFGTIRRRVILIALAAGIIGYLAWTFAPSGDGDFKPLEYLGYEALAMEEDPRGRIDLPSKNLQEIRQYLLGHPGLGFEPRVLKSLGDGWRPEGATIIDYEIAKVAVVQYRHAKANDLLFHFNYKGSLGDLPKADPGNLRGLIYQAYTNDSLNFIAWQHSSNTVSIIASRRGAVEMAELALQGGGK